MEGAGSQRKRSHVWRFGLPRNIYTNTPSKIGYEKRRLSLRSENAAIAETTTPQSSSSLFRQATGLLQKQPGKENESPLILPDSVGKAQATIAKSTIKRNKSINPTNYITDSEKKVIRRRLSGDYEDQLSLNKLYRATPIEPIIFSAKAIQPSEADVTKRFSVYDDGKANVFEIKSITASSVHVDAVISDKKITEKDESAEKNVENDGTSETQHSSEEQEFFNSRFVQEQKISGGEFHIEIIDSEGGRVPVMNKFREVKSGSDIKRLNVSVRRANDVSPLKRRINQLKRSGIITGRSYGINKKCGNATAAVVIGAVTMEEIDSASSKIKSKGMEVAKKVTGSLVPCSNRKREWECGFHKSTVDPSSGAIKKTCSRTSSEARQVEKNSSEICVSSATQQLSNKSKFVNARSPREHEISGAEFRIERVECIGGKTPTSHNISETKSGSDTGRLCIAVKKGNDVSSLKKRINRLKASGMTIGRSCGFNEKGAAEELAAEIDASNSKIESNNARATKKLKKSMIPCPGGPKERKHNVEESIAVPLTGAAKKKLNSRTSSEGTEIPVISEIQFATDYTKETIDLEYAREAHCYRISESFLEGKAVTPEQRRIVVNFLISVHAYLSTSSSTLYQATKIFDAILDIKDVSVKELQLVALGASWIAIKNMETRVPTASEMISFAKDMYHTEGPGLLCKCERKILRTLGFHIRFPDPYHISAYYLWQWSSLRTVTDEPSILKSIYHCAGYLMDVALLEKNNAGLSEELLAAATTQAAANLVLNRSQEHPMQSPPLNEEKLTRYTQEEIHRVIGPLLQGVLDSAAKDSPIGAVYKKYKNSRFDNTSDHLVLRIKKLLGLTYEGQN